MMRHALVLAALLASVEMASAQRAPMTPAKPEPVTPRTDSQKPRPASPITAQIWVGQTAPDFGLDDAQGRQVRFSKLRGDWIVLVFADRARDIAPLQKAEEEVRRLGARLVAVTHEKTRTLKSTARRDTVSLMMLSDITGQVSASYGMFDYERSEIRQGFLIIDRSRVVRLLLAGPLPPADALARLTEFSITGM